MRLIDADALIEKIWEKHKETEEEFDVCADELKELYCGVVSLIDEQPTAFDTEKVVEQLEEKIDITWKHDYLGGRKDAFKEAIDIVKKGGVE